MPRSMPTLSPVTLDMVAVLSACAMSGEFSNSRSNGVAGCACVRALLTVSVRRRARLQAFFVCEGVLARWRVDSVPLGERCDRGCDYRKSTSRGDSFSLIAFGATVDDVARRADTSFLGAQRSWSDYWECMRCCKRSERFFATRCHTLYLRELDGCQSMFYSSNP